jgi:hypothetical protein
MFSLGRCPRTDEQIQRLSHDDDRRTLLFYLHVRWVCTMFLELHYTFTQMTSQQFPGIMAHAREHAANFLMFNDFNRDDFGELYVCITCLGGQ